MAYNSFIGDDKHGTQSKTHFLNEYAKITCHLMIRVGE
eukprot:XP_001704833.1 Hypothetical protein GL50803_38650 [Giardia lamblia ATCC 50803]